MTMDLRHGNLRLRYANINHISSQGRSGLNLRSRKHTSHAWDSNNYMNDLIMMTCRWKYQIVKSCMFFFQLQHCLFQWRSNANSGSFFTHLFSFGCFLLPGKFQYLFWPYLKTNGNSWYLCPLLLHALKECMQRRILEYRCNINQKKALLFCDQLSSMLALIINDIVAHLGQHFGLVWWVVHLTQTNFVAKTFKFR